MVFQDVKTLKLTHNTTPPSPSSEPTNRAPFVCPLNLKEMNGVQPFVYISTCGCTFSQAGLKTVTSVSSSSKDTEGGNKDKDAQLDLCPQCATKFSKSDDVMLLNPPPEEEERMRAAMEKRRLLEPTKKSKKRKNASPAEESEPASKKKAGAGPSMNPSIAAASRAVVSSLAMEEAKRKANMSDAVKSLYGDGKERKQTFMTMGTFTRVSIILTIHL